MAERPAPIFPMHDGCEALTRLVLDHLPDPDALGPPQTVARHAAVWEPGDVADAVFFLRDGAVEVSRGGPDERRLLLRRVVPGEPFGELCVCAEQGGRRASTALAVRESAVVTVTLEDFLGLVRRSENALFGLVTTLCERLAEAEARAEILTHRDAEQRLARLLLHLARTERNGGDRPVRLALTHDQLARTAAMSRSHVSVVLGRFRERGLVDYAPGRPLVPNEDALRVLLHETS